MAERGLKVRGSTQRMTGHSHSSARAFLLAAAFAFAGLNPGASWAQDGGGGALDEILSRFRIGSLRAPPVTDTAGRKGMSSGARELGENEVPWRHCVYRGVREVLMPQARVPWLYQQAIEEDQAMTARIAKGELTRAERRQRLENLAENIRLTELLNPPHTQEQSADRELLDPVKLEHLKQMYRYSVLDSLGH